MCYYAEVGYISGSFYFRLHCCDQFLQVVQLYWNTFMLYFCYFLQSLISIPPNLSILPAFYVYQQALLKNIVGHITWGFWCYSFTSSQLIICLIQSLPVWVDRQLWFFCNLLHPLTNIQQMFSWKSADFKTQM